MITCAAAQIDLLTQPREPRVDRGYSRQVRAVVDDLPHGARVAAMQSGALGWWAGSATASQIRVVNLDGVVNGAAKEAIGARQLGAYLHRIGATHFADWDGNALMLQTYQGQHPEARLGDRLQAGTPGESFILYRIVSEG